MDEIDRSLFRALERNPRITCRELSKMLGISIPSVWKRMISLKQSGTIGGYMAIMSQEAMDVVRVNVFGRMEGGLDDKAIKALDDNDSICEVQIGGQNSLYIHCGLRHISDLDDVLRVAQDECRIDDPHPLIIGPGSILGISTSINKKDRPSIESLKDIDWQIIWSLHDNARKPVSEVAREVGVSTKTVKRRLDRLVKEELIEFYVVGDLNQSEELLFQVFIKLKSAAFRNTVQSKILKDYCSFVDNCLMFSNRPNLMNIDMVTQSVAQVRRVISDLKGLEGVENVAWDLVLETHNFTNWIDRVPEDRIKEIRARKGKGKGKRVNDDAAPA